MSVRPPSPAVVLLARYEHIAAITRAMLTAAHNEDWPAAQACGQQYCHAVEALRRDDEEAVVLTDEQRRLKYELLSHILANDAATRDLAMPQLARLGVLLGQLKRQQSLRHAYAVHRP